MTVTLPFFPRWYYITGDELDWNRELSRDSGRAWQLNWQIHYVRRE